MEFIIGLMVIVFLVLLYVDTRNRARVRAEEAKDGTDRSTYWRGQDGKIVRARVITWVIIAALVLSLFASCMGGR